MFFALFDGVRNVFRFSAFSLHPRRGIKKDQPLTFLKFLQQFLLISFLFTFHFIYIFNVCEQGNILYIMLYIIQSCRPWSNRTKQIFERKKYICFKMFLRYGRTLYTIYMQLWPMEQQNGTRNIHINLSMHLLLVMCAKKYGNRFD